MFSKDRSKVSMQRTVLPAVSEGKRIYLLVRIIIISLSVVTNTSKTKCVEWALYPEKAERAVDGQMNLVYGVVFNIKTDSYSVSTCLVSDEGGERLQRSVGVVEASHGFGPLEEQDVGHCHSPKPCREAGGRRRWTWHKNHSWQSTLGIDLSCWSPLINRIIKINSFKGVLIEVRWGFFRL